MDFKDQIKQLSERVAKLKENIGTEEATKTAFIMPFIQALGCDVFDPTEVVPEFTCDLGIKKGEKIDYAIYKDGQPIILIECKNWKECLDGHNGQLYRYYQVSNAKFGLLTNGIIYRFYTDLVEPNKLDNKPFFEINMEDLRETHIEKLKEFHKSYFDLDKILNTASELKYTNEIRNAIAKEIANPSDEFVKYFAKPVYTGRFYDDIFCQFREIVKQAFKQYMTDYVNERLKSAISPDVSIPSETPATSTVESSPCECSEADKIVTTEEEMQGFYIVRAILYNKVDDINRVMHRDTQSYFGILLDDNNRKPICRLHFNRSNKYIETFDAEKKGTKHLLTSLQDIYQYADIIRTTIDIYDA